MVTTAPTTQPVITVTQGHKAEPTMAATPRRTAASHRTGETGRRGDRGIGSGATAILVVS